MSERNALWIALPSALVGLGAGLALATFLRSAPPAEASTPEEPTSKPVVRPVSDAPIDAPPTAEREVAEAAPRSAPAAPTEREVDRAIAAVDAPTVAASDGTGRITGTVVDEGGAPLAGAVVIAHARTSGPRIADPEEVGGGPPLDLGLQEHLRAEADRWAKRRASRPRASTGADGAFRLSVAGGVSHSVYAYLEGYVVESDGRWDVQAGDEVELLARRVHTVPVELVHADGRAVAEGVLSVSQSQSGSSSNTHYRWTPASPVLRLTAGPTEVRAYSGVRGRQAFGLGLTSDFASDPVTIEPLDGAPVRLILNGRGGIRGTVLDPSGSYLDGGACRVHLLELATDEELDPDRLIEGGSDAWLRGGAFELADLAPGRYAVGVAVGDSLLVHAEAAVDGAPVEVTLELPAPRAEGLLTIHVTGPDGRSLDGVSFGVCRRSGRSSRSTGLRTRRRPDGSYGARVAEKFADFAEPWEEGVSFEITATHGLLGEREVELEPGQREIEVRFEEPASLEVTLTDFEGRGLGGKLQISVARLGEDGSTGESYSTPNRGWEDGPKLSARGVATFTGLRPGTWRISLYLQRDVFDSTRLASIEADLAAGRQARTLAVPPLYEVSVYAPGLSPGSRLELREGDGERSSRSDIDFELGDGHRGVVENVPAGTYSIHAWSLGTSQRIEVPCGEVVLEAREPDCLRVTIADVEGALYRAGMRSGDLWIGADGVFFAGRDDLNPIGGRLLTEEVSLIVLRDGEQLEIPLGPLGDERTAMEEMGGMFHPATRP